MESNGMEWNAMYVCVCMCICVYILYKCKNKKLKMVEGFAVGLGPMAQVPCHQIRRVWSLPPSHPCLPRGNYGFIWYGYIYIYGYIWLCMVIYGYVIDI